MVLIKAIWHLMITMLLESSVFIVILLTILEINVINNIGNNVIL